MAAPDYFQRKPSYTRSRPGLPSLHSTAPPSPHTPTLNRSASSHFASPGSYRAEEDPLVYAVGARSLRAGFAGDSTPRCTLGFGPDESRRVGDFRAWTSDDAGRPGSHSHPWGQGRELWSLDARTCDAGLVEDKIERALREAHTKHLMLDNRQRRAVLAVPAALPHPLLDVTLRTLFTAAQPTSIALWDSSLLCTVAAGLRSALVVDIGWHETTVSAIYEYRQVLHRQSVRAAKRLTRHMARTIRADAADDIAFETAEDVMTRMAWCQPVAGAAPRPESTLADQDVSIPLKTAASTSTRRIAFDELALPAEKTFFASSPAPDKHDDHDLPLHLLVYRCLLALPLDVRAICMSRIIITGGVSAIPGLKPRLIGEVEQLVETKGWDQVANYGSVAEKRKNGAWSIHLPVLEKPPDETESEPHTAQSAAPDLSHQVRAADAPHDKDDISEKLSREATRQAPVVQGVVRGVETLGVWAGASMVADLKVESVLEVKRDDFLKNGLASLGSAI
ncbi:hypothetical protein MBLNU459_g7249t3 [Dothideomycetes sp. NU459]